MTLQELSQYLKLRERLSRDEEILKSLEAAACPGAQVLTGMPHAPGVRDKVGDLAVEIADMKERIRFIEVEIEGAKKIITEYIAAVTDDRVCVIMRLHFLRGLTWQETADILGGRNTDESVRKLCYSYMDRDPQ